MSTTTDTTLRRIRNTTATLAAVLFAGRCAVGLGLIHLPEAVTFGALFPFLASLVTAGVTGYRLKMRKLERRAQSAEMEAARLRRAETLLDGDEDRKLWDSVKPSGTDEDTIAFNGKVVLMHRPRYPQAG